MSRLWHGFNLGNWLSQSTLKSPHIDTFYKEEDIALAAEWGFNFIRLPVDYTLFEKDEAPGVYDEARLKYVDKGISWCKTIRKQDSDRFIVVDGHAVATTPVPDIEDLKIKSLYRLLHSSIPNPNLGTRMRAEKFCVKCLKFKKITSHKNYTYPLLPI